MLNLEGYYTMFFVATLGLALVAAYPALAMVMPSPDDSEEFSEFWLLGPNHAADDYPFNVSAGEMYSVFVGVGNQMGCSEYYLVYVKFGNSAQFDFNSSKSSSLPPLYELRGFVGDGDFWETPMTFGFQNVSLADNVLYVDEVIINEMTFPVDAYSGWDSETSGFYFRLSFELWHYDTVLKSFMFHDRIVGLQLNMTDT